MAFPQTCNGCEGPVSPQSKKTGLCRKCFLESVNINGKAECVTCGNETSEPRADYCKNCWLNRPVEGRKITYRKYLLKRKYKLSLEEYDEMLISQDAKCAICLISQTELAYLLYVDHDRSCCPGSESCGECVRGLLCNSCNFAIGHFKDNETIMKSAIKYIRKHSKENF